MRTAITSFIIFFNYIVGAYFGIVNTVYAVLLTLALVAIIRHIRRVKYSPIREFRASPETPPVSILIPVHNEEKVAIRSIRAALHGDYPFFEVIQINDGSSDGTLQTVIDTFRLKKIDRVYRKFLRTAAVKAIYYNVETPNLLVVDKERGRKADALNCGISVSRCPYLGSVDANSLLEKDALIRLMATVLESNVPVVACGGVVRVLNGVRLREEITIDEVDLPEKPIILFQIVEYLRGFREGDLFCDYGHLGFEAGELHHAAARDDVASVAETAGIYPDDRGD